MRLVIWGLALGVAFFSLSSIASANGRTWILSGAELVEDLKGNGAPEVHDEELKRMVSNVRGNAYVAGVADALQNQTWCGAGSILPHELTDRVFTYLTDLPPESLKENAAKLVAQALEKEFPCRDIKKQAD